MNEEQLLVEVEELMRTMPPLATIRHATDENFSWFGRLSAVVRLWRPSKSTQLAHHLDNFQSGIARTSRAALEGLIIMLHEARHDLRMRTAGPLTAAFPGGAVFQYFDEVRKIIETARSDLLFVDPYLDAEFVSRYLQHVAPGVAVRLLARERLTALQPAVELFAQQTQANIAIRSASGFHDRYVFVDLSSGYHSGASFKDGARIAPTTITQITDAFGPVLKTYEDIWSQGKMIR